MVRDHIPQHAQKIFMHVFNSVKERTGDDERAFKSAWSRVHRNYGNPGNKVWRKRRPFQYELERKEKSLPMTLYNETSDTIQEYQDAEEETSTIAPLVYEIAPGDIIVDPWVHTVVVKSLSDGGFVTFERDGREMAKSSYSDALHMMRAQGMLVRRDGDDMMKSGSVLRPGARGGHPWRDDKGNWRYGKKPVQTSRTSADVFNEMEGVKARLKKKYGGFGGPDGFGYLPDRNDPDWKDEPDMKRLHELRDEKDAADRNESKARSHEDATKNAEARKQASHHRKTSEIKPELDAAEEEAVKRFGSTFETDARANQDIQKHPAYNRYIDLKWEHQQAQEREKASARHRKLGQKHRRLRESVQESADKKERVPDFSPAPKAYHKQISDEETGERRRSGEQLQQKFIDAANKKRG